MAENSKKAGGCLCGAVRFEVNPEKNEFDICHCGMCRKWSAGPFMAVHCTDGMSLIEDSGLAWYQGSEWAQRGFCSKCGTSLFWRLSADPDAMLSVSVEALEDAEEFALGRHIYVDAQPPRYEFSGKNPRVTEAELMVELGIVPGTLSV